MIKTIFFDLDGTLIDMNQEVFIKEYFASVMTYCYSKGFDGKAVINGVAKASACMVKNDGKTTNEAVFWDVFENETQIKRDVIEPTFMMYYVEAFDEVVVKGCKLIAEAQALVDAVRAKNIDIVISTNPLFPYPATYKRLQFASLDPLSFKLVTTYENSSFAKPNLAYYEEIMHKLNLKGEEVMMFGNDASEDYCVKELGVKVYLLKQCLINKSDVRIAEGDLIDYQEAIKIISEI